MKNLAKGSIAAFLVALLVGFIYFNQSVEAVNISADDSQESIQAINEAINSDNNNIEKYDINVEVNDEEESSAVESNSGGIAYKATAYCLRGKTASGRMVRRGIVAADPRVLRLGTRIHMTGGRYTGNYLVADTGGKIKGRILDIWVPSCSEARRWGRRTVRVKVISKAKSKRSKKRRKRKSE